LLSKKYIFSDNGRLFFEFYLEGSKINSSWSKYSHCSARCWQMHGIILHIQCQRTGIFWRYRSSA